VKVLIGGSPCQGFSFAGKQLNFDDPRSKLFFEYIRVLREYNPDYFLLENVMMKKEYQDIISEQLGVGPAEINSALVSAQNRVRLYWTNMPDILTPEDKGVLLDSVLEDLPDCPVGIGVRRKAKCIRVGGRLSPFGSKQEWDSPFQRISKAGKVEKGIEKAGCLTGGAHSGGNHSDMDIIHSPFATRRYSVTECERLQTVPDGYTDGVSSTQRYKMLGNGWTVDVIAHIFKNLPNHVDEVLSLFDGMSCGQLALRKAGKTYGKYYASEVDKYAIQIAQKNFPSTIQLGDVKQITHYGERK
jgi:site-specific DNA-cytosine methylase